MKTLGQFLQTGDWKGEKHVPVIHAPEKVKAGVCFDLKISIGDEIKHPNTLEHHISCYCHTKIKDLLQKRKFIN